MNKIKHGFVIVKSGKMCGRIGRYIGNDMADNDNAMVYFGYEGEELKYANYAELSKNCLSNDFSRADLLSRFYVLRRDLRKIDLRAHPEIRNYSAEHRSVLSEYNIIRMLINESLDVRHIDDANFNKRVFISYALNDALFVYDLVSDLEDYRIHSVGDSHELAKLSESLMNVIAEKCDAAIFVLSKNTDLTCLKSDYTFFKRYFEEYGVIKILFVLAESVPVPKFVGEYIDMSGNSGTRFHDLLNALSL